MLSYTLLIGYFSLTILKDHYQVFNKYTQSD